MNSQAAEPACVYSLEAIIALQKALENGISELVANNPEALAAARKSCTASSAANSSVVPAAAVRNALAPGSEPIALLEMVRRPQNLLSWIRRKLSRRHRSVQRGA